MDQDPKDSGCAQVFEIFYKQLSNDPSWLKTFLALRHYSCRTTHDSTFSLNVYE